MPAGVASDFSAGEAVGGTVAQMGGEYDGRLALRYDLRRIALPLESNRNTDGALGPGLRRPAHAGHPEMPNEDPKPTPPYARLRLAAHISSFMKCAQSFARSSLVLFVALADVVLANAKYTFGRLLSAAILSTGLLVFYWAKRETVYPGGAL